MNADLGSYAGAILSLALKALDRGLSLPLHDVEALLCEDGRTVMLLAPAGNDDWLSASFELSEKTDESTFDIEKVTT